MRKIRVTQPFKRGIVAAGDDQGSEGAIALAALNIIDQLIDRVMDSDPAGAAEISKGIIAVSPRVTEAIIAMASGVLAGVERDLEDSAQTVDGLRDTDPELLDKLKNQIGKDMGLSAEQIADIKL